MSFGNRDGRTCVLRCRRPKPKRQTPEGGKLRSLRTQQRAYDSFRPVLEVPADKPLY
jgi:hypothetical protein